MANPFLFEADYGGGAMAGMGTDPSLASASAAAAAANPFLSDFGGGGDASSTMPDFGAGAMSAAEANPFLSYQPSAAATEVTYTTTAMPQAAPAAAAAASNPFASFVDASMEVDSAPPPTGYGGAQSTGAAVFGAVPSTTGNVNQGAALFGGTDPPAPAVAVDMLLDIHEEPTRPPPASVPSSTQDLLDTVTGALEATSDSLMDRLRAAQPSPIPQVIQPSPSPRSPSPDLLMGDDPPPPPPPSANPLQPSPGFNQVDSIMDMFDAPKSGPKSSQEILGLYNSTTTTTVAPSKGGDSLLDLLDSAPPAAPTESTAEPAPAPQATVPPPQPTETESLNREEETRPTPPSALDLKHTTTKTATAPQQVEPMVISPAKPEQPQPEPVRPTQPPQPMRPPPPKAAPPERPKPPPVPQQPAPPPPAPAPAPVVAATPSPPAPVAPPQPIIEPPVPEPAVAETRSPLPSRPPPPVPPAPRVSPQPQVIAEPQPPSKSPSPPPAVASMTTTPSPTKPPPPPVVPPQPKAPAPPVVPAAPSPAANIFAPAAPVAPAAAPPPTNIFEQSTTVTSNSINSSSSPFAASNSSSFGGTSDYSTTGGRDAFSSSPSTTPAPPPPAPIKQAPAFAAAQAKMGDSFDAFEAKFSRAGNAPTGNAFGDPFGGGGTTITTTNNDLSSAWGDDGGSGGGFGTTESNDGFGNDAGFDSFLSLTEPPPVPQSTPAKRSQAGDDDFDEEEKEMAIVIKPKSDKDFTLQLAPALAPPPKSPAMSTGSAFSDENTAYVPFLSSAKDSSKSGTKEPPSTTGMHRSDSQDSPQTPLYEEDQSQPLEDFPRITYAGDGWEMHMRLPNKKKITGNRFWKKCFVKVGHQNDTVPIVQIYNNKGDKDPFQEIPLQPCYSVSEISAQQFDQYGKVFTIKLQYIFYKERPGVRPGQLSKASRISDKLTQFAAYAIQGDYSGVKEFGSDLKKLGAPIEHSPQISQLCKLGIANYEDIKIFSIWIEENLFRMSVHRDRAINYKTEEIQVTLVDEYFAEQDIYGVVTRQIARVRLFFLSFLNGNAEIEMGVNDLRRQGKEIVGRHDICPVPTEEWIRMEAIEFSNCVQLDEFENTQTIKFKPPDACYIELMRFRVRPPRHRELPLQVKTVFTMIGQRIEIKSDILVPGFTSRKLGQIPCEDVSVRFPIPEEWIYMFRVEKHFRYGSVKSAHRRTGKVKGIERLLGAVEAVEQSLMETTSGQAKYEHHHKAIVWRIPRLPKEGQGAYTTHSFFCHITLQAHERIPDNLTKHCYIEFTMPHTTISHTVCRSISVPSCDEPPEKCCRYLSRHEYIVEIEYAQGMGTTSYTAAAAVKKEEAPPPVPEEPEKPMPGKAESDSDFSDD